MLPRHRPHLAGELPLEESSEDLRRRQFRLQLLHDFIDVSGLVGFQQDQDSLLVRRSPSSGNRDAEAYAEDSAEAVGVSASRTSVARSSHTSSHVAILFQRAVMRLPEYSAASTTSTSTDMRSKFGCESENSAAPETCRLEIQKSAPRQARESAPGAANFPGMKYVHARLENRASLAFRRDRPAMARVSTPRR
jgi:hypothetical protein